MAVPKYPPRKTPTHVPYNGSPPKKPGSKSAESTLNSLKDKPSSDTLWSTGRKNVDYELKKYKTSLPEDKIKEIIAGRNDLNPETSKSKTPFPTKSTVDAAKRRIQASKDALDIRLKTINAHKDRYTTTKISPQAEK